MPDHPGISEDRAKQLVEEYKANKKAMKNLESDGSKVSALTKTTERPVCLDDSENSALIAAELSGFRFDCLLDSG